MSLENHYNKKYSENEMTYGGGLPEKIVMRITKYKSSGSVLDLGAGEGRNSLYLAEQGFEVTAQDISGVGLKKLSTLAAEKGLHIQTEIKDIRTAGPEKNYDVFVCIYVLHIMSRSDALFLIKQIQEHTNTDGLNIITAITDDGDFYRSNPDTKRFYPKTNELKELYEGWEILGYKEHEHGSFLENLDGSQKTNVLAQIIAKKR